MDKQIRYLERLAETDKSVWEALWVARNRAGQICNELASFPPNSTCMLPNGHLGMHVAKGLTNGSLVGWVNPRMEV